jgi:galactokinase
MSASAGCSTPLTGRCATTEVSVPEVDLLVDLARGEPRVHGARLTGGGFGGAIVLLVETGHAAGVAGRVADSYARRSGRTPTVLVPPPADVRV